MEKKKKKNTLLTIIQIVLIAIMIFSAYKIINYYYQNWNSTRQINIAKSAVERIEEEHKSEDKEIDKDELAKKIIKELKEQNKDIVAFVRQKEAKINFPVAYVREDNDYYLYRDLEENFSLPGTIFLNGYNEPDFKDMNSTLFGHHLKVENADMFAPMFKLLLQYEKPENVDPNKEYIIELFTEDGYKEYKIFAAYFSDIYDDYVNPNFDQDGWTDYLAERRDKSTNSFNFNHEFNENDHILTLSTCDYVYDSEKRYVVQGVLVE